jgi:hypothetical protein
LVGPAADYFFGGCRRRVLVFVVAARAANILLVAAQPTTDPAIPAVSPADPVAEPAATLRIGDPAPGVLAAQGGSRANEDVGDSLAVMR